MPIPGPNSLRRNRRSPLACCASSASPEGFCRRRDVPFLEDAPSSVGTEALGRARACFGGLDLAIAWRRGGDQRLEQLMRDRRHLSHRAVEGCLVCPGRPPEAAQLAHELQRRGAYL